MQDGFHHHLEAGCQAGHNVRDMYCLQSEEISEGRAHQPVEDGICQGASTGARNRTTNAAESESCYTQCEYQSRLMYISVLVGHENKCFKGTVSSHRARNRCPSEDHSDWKLLAHLCISNGYTTLSCGGIIFSHGVNLKLALRFHALLIVTILSL